MKLTSYFPCLILSIFLGCSTHSNKDFSIQDFKTPPANVHVHTWWHWMDGRITREGITKDLESMKQQGIVQATILNIGMSAGKNLGVKRISFNTEEWYEMFRWALHEAKRLGITIGVHNCDGWSESGGPWITPEMSMKKFVFTKTLIPDHPGHIKLPRPLSETGFYRDVAVIAFQNKSNKQYTIRHELPEITMNDTLNGMSLADGNPESMMEVREKYCIRFSYPSKELKTKIALLHNFKGAFYFPGPKTIEYTVKASDDGVHFRKIADIATDKFYVTYIADIPATKAKYFQVEVSNIHNLRPWHHAALAELQLLGNDEQPAYCPTILYPLEKAASARIIEPGKLYTANTGIGPEDVIPGNSVINITGKMLPDGTLNWDKPEGNWSVIRFGYTTTGAVNGPATKEGTGLECDKMDTLAVNFHFRNFPQKLIDHAGRYTGNTFKFLMIDSWERGYQTWTQAMPGEFEKRRGYSLLNWIPVLCGETIESTEQSEGVLYDFRKTIADLFEQNYYKHFNDLCHRNRLQLHGEVIYGDTGPFPPLDVLRTNDAMDMPMYEFWADINNQNMVEYQPAKNLMVNFPAYTSNFYDKPVIGAEAYTGFAHYSESPADLKLFGDRAYCSGINQMILHSYVHQPAEKKPGLTLGRHGSHFNRHNPWWQYAKGWIDYQSRIQYILQKGNISAGILYFPGDQLPWFFENKTISSLPEGYQTVPCNFDVLQKLSVSNGKLCFSKGQDYSLLVLPDRQFMEFSTLRQIERLVKEGAVVYGNKPVQMFSLSGKKNDKREFEKLSDEVWSGYRENLSGQNRYGKGLVIWGEPVAKVLNELKLKPDFSTNRPDSVNIMYIHKNTEHTDVFFVVNQQDSAYNRECLFCVSGKVPEIWDPLTGEVKKPAVYSIEDGQVRLPVSFKPRESLFFIFTDEKPANYICKVESDGKQLFPSTGADIVTPVPGVYFEGDGNYKYIARENGNYTFITCNGEKTTTSLKTPEIKEIKDFKGKIKFHPVNSGRTDSIGITELKSFTDFQAPEIKYFSGTAEYEIDFDLPPSYINDQENVALSLGGMEATAEVYLNGKLLGNIWMSGCQLPVEGLLKEKNHLKIRLGTTCRNRIIGDLTEYGELKNLWTAANVKSYLNKNSALKPSGITGPLQLIRYLPE